MAEVGQMVDQTGTQEACCVIRLPWAHTMRTMRRDSRR